MKNMEYAKDEVFEISYITKLNRLKAKKESWTSRICKKIKNHKLFVTVVIAFCVFAICNMIMMYNFMKIFGTIH